MLHKLFPDIEFDESVGIEAEEMVIWDFLLDEDKVKSWNHHVKTWNIPFEGSEGGSRWVWLMVNTLIFKGKTDGNPKQKPHILTLWLEKGPGWLTGLTITYMVEPKLGYISLRLHAKMGVRPFFIKRWLAAVLRRQLSQSLEELKTRVEKH
jgi:hypothetical protein